MGRRKYPPLKVSEAESILIALGFAEKHCVGSHSQWERPAQDDRERAIVTVDQSIDEFDERLIKSMIRQSRCSREEFYGATKRTAKKIGVAVGAR